MAHTVSANAKLLVKLQGQGSRVIDIQGDNFLIGRKTTNDLPIDDHTVSGQHAKIMKVQSVYFLQDLGSTNGTLVNGKSIERHQLRDADVITIGQHRIIFQEPVTHETAQPQGSEHLDRTMVISSKSSPASSPTISAKVLVTDGKTDRLEYHLTKPVNVIGARDGAAIRLTAWFAPKSAAQISQKGGSYFVSLAPGGKRLLVNGKEVVGQQQLKNGDQIEVAGILLTFYLVSPGT
ncbi:MAG TPA: FHA domain-containing protein [Nitrospira sp.]